MPEAVFAHARARMETPTPRVQLGLALRGVASASADISDGLLGDLGHILDASGVGATLDLPVVETLLGCSALWSCPRDLAHTCLLAGGDDYELVFTAPPQAREQVLAASSRAQTPVTRIGTIRPGSGTEVLDAQGQPLARRFASFDHFAVS